MDYLPKYAASLMNKPTVSLRDLTEHLTETLCYAARIAKVEREKLSEKSHERANLFAIRRLIAT